MGGCDRSPSRQADRPGAAVPLGYTRMVHALPAGRGRGDHAPELGPLIHPGLVQTEAYAFEVLAVEPSTAGRLNELVAARMDRQQVLQRVYLTVVIYAPVMYHLIGAPAVMAEQSGHLLELAQRPNISLHIVPEGSNTGVWGAIDIASHDGADTVCLTTGLNDVTTTSTDVADQAMRAFDRILGAAMPAAESLDFVRAAEGHWKEQT